MINISPKPSNWLDFPLNAIEKKYIRKHNRNCLIGRIFVRYLTVDAFVNQNSPKIIVWAEKYYNYNNADSIIVNVDGWGDNQIDDFLTAGNENTCNNFGGGFGGGSVPSHTK